MAVWIATCTHPMLLPRHSNESMYAGDVDYLCSLSRSGAGGQLTLSHQLVGSPLLRELILCGKARFGVKLRATMTRRAEYGDVRQVDRGQSGVLELRQPIDISAYDTAADRLVLQPVIALGGAGEEQQGATEEGTGIQDWYLDGGRVRFPPYAILAKADEHRVGGGGDGGGGDEASLARLCSIKLAHGWQSSPGHWVEMDFSPGGSPPFTLWCRSDRVRARFSGLLRAAPDVEDAEQRALVNFLLAACYAKVHQHALADPDGWMDELLSADLRAHCEIMQEESGMDFAGQEFDAARLATTYWGMVPVPDPAGDEDDG